MDAATRVSAEQPGERANLDKAIEIKRRAQRCVQNGDLDGALREYEKLVETPDADPYHFVLLADLLFKKGDQGRASERYLDAVGAYQRASLYKNAIAVCKKMLRLNLSQGPVLRNLAELHALDGLTGEAALYWTQYAEVMVRANQPLEAASALRKAFENAHDDVRLLEQLAEVQVVSGEDAVAAGTLLEASVLYRARGRMDDAQRCETRAGELDSSASMPLPELTLPESLTVPGLSASSAVESSIEPVVVADERPASPFRLEVVEAPASDSLDLDRPAAFRPPVSVDEGGFERAPSFAPPLESPESIATPPVPETTEAPSNVTPLPLPVAESVPTPSTIAERPSVHALDEAQVEAALARAQEEFRAGRRDEAALALVEAARGYESLGRLENAATILRSLGRGGQATLETLRMWLDNCERRGDRTEAAQVACELGDRAINDGDESAARGWFERALAIDAGHALARRRLQRLAGEVPDNIVPLPLPAAPAADQGRVEVALGRAEAASFDLAGLLQEFRRGVESQLEGDAQGHYDLGMAYREMGLGEQAIEAFRAATADAALAVRAHEMIGRCHADAGQHEDAVHAFEAGLVSSPDAEGEAELHVLAAHSLATLGRHAEAVEQLEAAEAVAPGRADVAERLVEYRSLRKAA